MLYCVSLALSVSRFVFVIDFVVFSLLLPTGLLSLHSLFPSIYDIDGCATTAAYIVSGWVFTLWPRAGFFRLAYVRIQSIIQNHLLSSIYFLVKQQYIYS